MKPIHRFFSKEGGAVAIDWVVLSAAVVALAWIVYTQINGPTGNVANGVGNSLSNTNVSTKS
ncbi:hypothetical protein [Ruegeria marisrubri]|uniref:hypothetical protein n=1 Tax=Ruegeria marisrubri TaxID=1685379 RepID=UPI000BFECE7E|nr:hypothetical protein [Ruegeria marisrubri]